MRGLSRFAASSNLPITAALSSQPFSTIPGGGAGGRGRGRGTGSPPISSPFDRVPGQSNEIAGDEDPFASASASFGHGRGHLPLPSSPDLPSLSSIISSLKPSSSAGRGRGGTTSDAQHPQPKQPIFFQRSDSESSSEKSQFADAEEYSALPRSISPVLSGSGRGKPPKPSESGPRAAEENRHLRGRAQTIGQRRPSGPTQSKASNEQAVRRAVEILNRGGRSGPGGRGRGGRGMVGRGRGRGRGEGLRDGGDGDEGSDLYLGNNADGEKLEKRLGEEKMKILSEAFEEASLNVFPSPLEEAYLDALHTNNLIEYEPEYVMEFDRNPDIDEKPPMPLEEVLAAAKPFLMAYTGMKNQEEWEFAMEDLKERLPYLKELVDMYSGPGRVTAKEQQEELKRLANMLPKTIPASVRRFTDRAVLSLQSNPGWGFGKKCDFMNRLVEDVSRHYK